MDVLDEVKALVEQAFRAGYAVGNCAPIPEDDAWARYAAGDAVDPSTGTFYTPREWANIQAHGHTGDEP